MSEYKTVSQRIADAFYRRRYVAGVGFVTIVNIHHMWANVVRLEVLTRDGRHLSLLRMQII